MNAAPPLLSRKILLPFIIVTLIWGSTWIVIRDQLGVVPPSWSVTYRFALSALVMFIVAAATRQKIWLGRSALAFALLFGIAQFVFNFNFVYRAEQHVTSGLVAVVFALLFVPNAVFGRIFLGHAITARFGWGSLLAIIGLALLFVNEARSDPGQTTQTLIGIGFTLGFLGGGFHAVKGGGTPGLADGSVAPSAFDQKNWRIHKTLESDTHTIFRANRAGLCTPTDGERTMSGGLGVADGVGALKCAMAENVRSFRN